MKTKKKKDQWSTIHYPNISDADNDLIRIARRNGFAVFYPASDFQDALTLEAAKKFLDRIGS